MASIMINKATTSIRLPSSTSSACPFPNRKTTTVTTAPFHKRINISSSISCSSSSSSDGNINIDRRNVLIGLGGLYGASAAPKISLAAPIAAPELTKCHQSESDDGQDITCCPPSAALNVTDFVPPDPKSPLRVRPAAHLVDDDYIAKFTKAIALMRALPADDPRNFMQQAKVHCAYCDNAYDQVGFPDMEIQVHGSWAFLPWHRCYLYFFERILGKLIGDDSFAMPFWNWDSPDGMRFPAMYTDASSSLFDSTRNPRHQPPRIVDLNYGGRETTLSEARLIDQNLKIMYRQMVSSAPSTQLFMGNPYRAGGDPLGPGSLENVPHGPVHVWTGDDMSLLYSAARDPVFYAHHSNIDRLWTVWKTLPGGRRVNPTDPDFLNSAFIFYDENAQPVRIKISDVLDSNKLRYTYADVDDAWTKSRPRVTRVLNSLGRSQEAKAAEFGTLKFPLTLGSSAVSTRVKRLQKSAAAKGDEVLVVDDIEVAADEYVKFDVYINAPEHHHEVGAAGRELAGSFVNVPHKHRHGKKRETKAQLLLCVDEILEDLGAQGDESVVVTLVPKSGHGKIKIGGIKMDII